MHFSFVAKFNYAPPELHDEAKTTFSTSYIKIGIFFNMVNKSSRFLIFCKNLIVFQNDI